MQVVTEMTRSQEEGTPTKTSKKRGRKAEAGVEGDDEEEEEISPTMKVVEGEYVAVSIE